MWKIIILYKCEFSFRSLSPLYFYTAAVKVDRDHEFFMSPGGGGWRKTVVVSLWNDLTTSSMLYEFLEMEWLGASSSPSSSCGHCRKSRSKAGVKLVYHSIISLLGVFIYMYDWGINYHLLWCEIDYIDQCSLYRSQTKYIFSSKFREFISFL